MRSFEGHHDEADSRIDAPANIAKPLSEIADDGIAGRFWARIWGIDCVLEWHLEGEGRMKGSFEADGERLEVTGESSGSDGEVRGVICAINLEEKFATFRARLDADDLFLEMDVSAAEIGLETAGQVIFKRLS